MRLLKVSFLMFLIVLIGCSSNDDISDNEDNTIDNEDNEKDDFVVSFSSTISSSQIYSKNVNVGKLEAFDIDKEGNVYYARLGDADEEDAGHNIYIYKAKPDIEDPPEYMILQHFGHPYNISIDDDGDETFLWIGSNGSRHSTGKYWDELSFSRIKYESGKTYKDGYGGDNYFLNDNKLKKTQVDVNRENNRMVVAAQSKKGKSWSFFTYDLAEAEALSRTLFSFTVKNDQTMEREVEGRDLSELKPIGSFTVEDNRDDKPNALNSYWLQGFGIDNNENIYFYEGEGNRKGRAGHAYITGMSINGDIVGKRTRVEATETYSGLDNVGILHDSADLEPEGMTIKNGFVYLGFISRLNEGDKKANILRYRFFLDD